MLLRWLKEISFLDSRIFRSCENRVDLGNIWKISRGNGKLHGAKSDLRSLEMPHQTKVDLEALAREISSRNGGFIPSNVRLLFQKQNPAIKEQPRMLRANVSRGENRFSVPSPNFQIFSLKMFVLFSGTMPSSLSLSSGNSEGERTFENLGPQHPVSEE